MTLERRNGKNKVSKNGACLCVCNRADDYGSGEERYKIVVNSPYISLVSSEEAGIAFPIFFLPPLILLIFKCSHPLDFPFAESTYSTFTNILSASIETTF